MSRVEENNSNGTFAEPLRNTADEIKNNESNYIDYYVKYGTEDHVEHEIYIELEDKNKRLINVDDFKKSHHAANTDIGFSDEVYNTVHTSVHV